MLKATAVDVSWLVPIVIPVSGLRNLFEFCTAETLCCCELLQYTFTCTLGTLPSGAPTPTFQLNTRYPAYTCPGCAGGLHKQAGVPAGDSSDGEGEAEQLCPLHVQAVYVLQGSHTADNIGSISKVRLKGSIFVA